YAASIFLAAPGRDGGRPDPHLSGSTGCGARGIADGGLCLAPDVSSLRAGAPVLSALDPLGAAAAADRVFISGGDGTFSGGLRTRAWRIVERTRASGTGALAASGGGLLHHAIHSTDAGLGTE